MSVSKELLEFNSILTEYTQDYRKQTNCKDSMAPKAQTEAMDSNNLLLTEVSMLQVGPQKSTGIIILPHALSDLSTL